MTRSLHCTKKRSLYSLVNPCRIRLATSPITAARPQLLADAPRMHLHAADVDAVHDPDHCVCLLVVVAPVGAQALLASDIPDVQPIAAREGRRCLRQLPYTMPCRWVDVVNGCAGTCAHHLALLIVQGCCKCFHLGISLAGAGRLNIQRPPVAPKHRALLTVGMVWNLSSMHGRPVNGLGEEWIFVVALPCRIISGYNKVAVV